MADETLRFDIVGEDRLSGPLDRAGASAGTLSRHMDAAARSAKVLDEALRKQNTASRVSVDATLALARADKILEDAEHGLRDGALEAEFALKKQAEAAKQSGRAAAKAALENEGLARSLQKVADSARKGGPGLLPGAALALAPAIGTLAGVTAAAGIGLAGAFTAGAAALVAFGAVAKPVLSSALTAEQAVNTAQNTYQAALESGKNKAKAYAAEQLAINKAYADLSPQQIALSGQLGNMAQAWQNLKAAQTPVVAGALQPWLKSVTDLTKNLAPVIANVSPVIGRLGTQFDTLIRSPQFKAFRDFIANTGSSAVGAIGGTLIDFIDAFITLLPQFNPLIEKAVGWIANLGPAVKTWASSQNTADNIAKFMVWFANNGPAVGGFLKNIGAALKTLAPGLTAGGTAELKVMSDFFGWVAKLPKGLAAPLAETAGALLLLNKLGVFSVGVKFVGLAAGWVTKLLGGGATAEIGAAGMQRAGDTMAAAAVAMQRAADTMIPAKLPGAPTVPGEPVPAAAGPDLVPLATKAAIATGAGLIAAGFILEFRKDLKAGWTAVEQDGAKMMSGLGGILSVSASGIADLAVSKLKGEFQKGMDALGGVISRWWSTVAAGAKTAGSVLAGNVAGVWSAILAGAKLWWGNITSAILTGVRTLADGVLKVFGTIINGAAKAFGWIPLIGGPLKAAAAQFSTFAAQVNAALGGIQNRTITVTVDMAAGTAVGSGGGTRLHAARGLYVAQGTGPAADDVLIRASRGELVVPASIVASGLVDHLKGLIPGFASGGTVASRGAAYLKGWHRSAGTVNAQIGHWTRALHIDAILAGAAGLSKTLHAKYAKAEASDKKTLAGLTAERTVLRDWRTELSGSDVSLTAWIAAAGKTPQLKANVAAWKRQLAGQQKTIGEISAMLGLTGAQLAADAASAKGAAAASAASAAAVAAASSAGGGAAGTAAAAAATVAAAVPLTPAAALALLTGGSGGVVIPPLAGPGEGAGAFPWSSGGAGAGGWPGWGGWGGGQGGTETGVPGQRAGSGGGPDPLLAEVQALRAEIRNLTGVAAAIPRATGQHVGDVVNGIGAAGSFARRYG